MSTKGIPTMLDEPKNVLVVKVTTSYYQTTRGLAYKKSIDILRRKSSGCNIFEEELNNRCVEDVIYRIVNLSTISDGEYTVVVINQSTDWETGYVEDWDYKLVALQSE